VLGIDDGDIDGMLLSTMVGETLGSAVLGINEGNINGMLNIDGALPFLSKLYLLIYNLYWVYDGGRDA